MKDSHDIDRSYIFIYPINHKLCHARYFCLPVFLFSKHIIDTCWKLPWIFFQTIINFFDSRKNMFGCLIAFQRIQQISPATDPNVQMPSAQFPVYNPYFSLMDASCFLAFIVCPASIWLSDSSSSL